MPEVPFDRDREHRIDCEVIVDCYHDEEVTMGWYYYLHDRLEFPFEAEWFPPGQSQAETVRAIGMADEEECKTDMLVEIEYREGDLVHQPIQLKKHGRRAKSLFRLGFDHLRHLVLNPTQANRVDFQQALQFLSCT